MFSVVSKTLFVVLLACAFLSCYEARPEGDTPDDATTPDAGSSAAPDVSGSPDATGATASPDSSAGTASAGDGTSVSTKAPLDENKTGTASVGDGTSAAPGSSPAPAVTDGAGEAAGDRRK